DTANGKPIWSADVRGKARGLAVAGGRLFVSTDTGAIHCFVQGSGGKGRTVAHKPVAQPFPKDDRTDTFPEVAADIVKEFGVTRGFALMLGGDGRLALELARRTDLLIYVVEPDGKRVAAMRRGLGDGGVYGGKVVVVKAGPDRIPFADYFANLIICEDGFFDQGRTVPAGELVRMLKPCGGVALISRPAGAAAAKTPPQVKPWMQALLEGLQKVGEIKPDVGGNWSIVTRGKLEGAGSWTHQYAEPGNTACSDDQLVRGAIGVLWFGEPGPKQMPSRHASNVSPLAVNGRLFVQGENVVMAYDAYNGLCLWEQPMSGALRLHLKGGVSNLAANTDSVFVAIGDRCLRLDQATGKTLKVYKTPAKKDDKHPNWRYVACVGNLLCGCTQSGRLFAVEIDTGKVRWTHDPGDLMETTICMSAGRLFFVDRSVTKEQREAGLKGVDPKMRVDTRGKPVAPDVRLVVALSAETGQVLWEQPQYVADCVKIGKSGGELTAMVASDVLVLCGQPWNGHFWSEFFAGQFSRRSLIALSAKDGAPLWSGRKGYRSRPLIVGDQIVAEPWMHDLYTGTPKMREHPVTGAEATWQMARPGHHCGNIAACTNALFFRSGTTAYYDLKADHGTDHFGAQRPGCWINCIPANGVITMPEASSGCVCPFSLVTTITFQPRRERRMWGMFSAPGPMTPVKHLAVNFGASGDRRDSKGTLWLAYPRPYEGRLVLDLKLGVTEKRPGGATYARTGAAFMQVAGTDDPWLHATQVAGCAEFAIPLSDKGDTQATYTVRLYFSAPEGDRPGRRVFDVKLQGKTVLEGFDVARQAGGAERELIREFKGVAAGRNLTLELATKAGEVSAATRPILSGVEIIRE
ncbi:MAG TPA: PQQ-binding-like beta-propeller repeat protein, partial [Phycisphaerae bacterium]|nr:PQQ-binding-like beta-propeller repeat protein [Phycisphaerae bacterium]